LFRAREDDAIGNFDHTVKEDPSDSKDFVIVSREFGIYKIFIVKMRLIARMLMLILEHTQ
jgi:hypothetical protein